MKKQQGTIAFYRFDSDLEALSSFPALTTEETDKRWSMLMKGIIHYCEKNYRLRYDPSSQGILPKLGFLFIKETDCTKNGKLLDYLPGSHLRPISKGAQLSYFPIITIAPINIPTLFIKSEPFGSLDYDPRLKFLDACIWHRSIYLDVERKTQLPKSLPALIEEILHYHSQGLFATIAARTALDFHLRMLKNSYIAQVGNKGHNREVTPFKFHSETAMAKEADTISNYFDRIKIDDESLKKHLAWKVLMVDDYTERPISTDPRANQKVAISKKALIKSLLNDFNIDIQSPHGNSSTLSNKEAGQDIIRKSIDRLQKESFDIILLDYLLGGKSDNNNTREFGHHFLDQLKIDSKQETTQLNLGPFSKTWIFPISSFPFALSDKLKQLGVDSYSEIWHISRGGDPISSPHLFRYYLYKFIRQQVLECFMEGYALTKYLRPLNHIQQIEIWASAAIKKIDSLELKRIFLESDLDKTPFINAAYEITANGFRKVIKQLNSLLNILSLGVKNYSILKQFETSWSALKVLLKEEKFPLYEDLLTFLTAKFEQSIYASTREIREAIAKGTGMQFNLSEKRLLLLPDVIGENKQLRILWLNDNNLEQLPDTFSQLTSLERLYLSHNNFLSFPKSLKTLVLSHQLYYIDFRDNPLPGISRKIATNKEEAKQMVEEVDALLNPQKRIEVIEEFIRAYDLDTAIDYFKKQIQLLDEAKVKDEINDGLIILESDYTWLERTRLMNTINPSEYQIQRSKLNDRMLGLLKLLPKEPMG